MRTVAALLLVALTVPAAAQVRPQPGPGDPRIQVVSYDPDQVVQLQVAPGYQLSVEFAPDERIENIALGDPNGWSATPNRRGDHLFIAATGGSATNMTVVTDAHTYEFELIGGGGGTQPFAVRFQYPAATAAAASPEVMAAVGRYRLGGARALRPAAMADDGRSTTIVWAPGRTLPAIFTVDGNGVEAVANGAMRGDHYVVDGIAGRYLFRLDGRTATAVRVVPRPARLMSPVPVQDPVRPVVRTARGWPTWVFALGLGAVALLLFVVLDTNRRALTAPAVRATDAGLASTGTATGVPTLDIPPPPLPPPPQPEQVRVILAPRGPAPITPPPPPLRTPPQIVYVPQALPPPPPSVAPRAPGAGGTSAGGSPLVYDATVAEAATAAAPAADAANGGGGPTGASSGAATTQGTARATLLRHGATTVPQGTLIPATLETALDSTRPGLARAIVSRDVAGFDGSRILVPRGSRLIGEYRSDVQRGQKRLLVTWTRLVRPDGAIVALASPSSDPLGRAGIPARVNSHFLERFAGAILQTVLNVGETFASRAGRGDTVAIIGGPGLVSGSVTPLTSGSDVPPTLRVRQGVSINVFVARDLDFTAVEGRR